MRLKNNRPRPSTRLTSPRLVWTDLQDTMKEMGPTAFIRMDTME